MMEQLKHMKNSLICCAQSQMNHLDQVDAEELGEVVEMIKNIEEAIYYCTITKAMEGKDYSENSHMMMNGNSSNGHSIEYYRDMDRGNGKMYYMENPMMYYPNSGNSNSNRNVSSNRGNESSSRGDNASMDRRNYPEYEREYPLEMRDYREGKSPRSRKTYMEAKQSHMDKTTQMRELEKYVQELGQDLVDMVEDASTEERQYLEKKLNLLASKVGHMNG